MAEDNKQHKLLFKSSEKSNFILNMTDEKLRTIVMRLFLAICIFIPVMCLILEFTEDGALLVFPSTALYIIGVFAMVLFVIGLLKKKFNASNKFTLIVAAIMLALGIASTIYSYASHVPFMGMSLSELKNYLASSPTRLQTTILMPIMGNTARNEGFLSLLFYLFIFVVAGLLAHFKKIVKFFDFFIGLMLFQCFWSTLQIFNIVPNYYENLSVLPAIGVNLPSGISGSPIAFALMLTMGLGIALGGACFDASKKRRTIYTISACLFAFFSIATVNIAGITGAIFVLLIALTIIIGKLIAAKDKKDASKALLMVVFVIASAGLGVGFTVICDLPLYDGAIMYQEAFFKLGATGAYIAKEATFDVANPLDMYGHFRDVALEQIKQNPLCGHGPDCFILLQFDDLRSALQANTLDRPYNEYLYIAASYGIPFVLAYISVLVFSVVRSVKGFAAAKASSEGWIFLSLMLAVVGFAAASVFGSVNVAVAPFVWAFAGIACGQFSSKKAEK